jgi:hypothetical protein
MKRNTIKMPDTDMSKEKAKRQDEEPPPPKPRLRQKINWQSPYKICADVQ